MGVVARGAPAADSGGCAQSIQRGEFKPVDAEQLVWAVMAAYDLNLPQISETFVERLSKGLELEGSEEAWGGLGRKTIRTIIWRM